MPVGAEFGAELELAALAAARAAFACGELALHLGRHPGLDRRRVRSWAIFRAATRRARSALASSCRRALLPRSRAAGRCRPPTRSGPPNAARPAPRRWRSRTEVRDSSSISAGPSGEGRERRRGRGGAGPGRLRGGSVRGAADPRWFGRGSEGGLRPHHGGGLGVGGERDGCRRRRVPGPRWRERQYRGTASHAAPRARGRPSTSRRERRDDWLATCVLLFLFLLARPGRAPRPRRSDSLLLLRRGKIP